uniref:Fanconi-associated nuclease n=1 Tax=Mucochytrium quahogii TaxID=96639 RepID=A0A7S2WA52_9STRA|mmetsp:Transcript_2565/g.5000  ORF Transcript_2565/g.5000 Transcript_2565/m.5000 type:complete len:855 (+) Transcript_2565:128-2692(+)|eukprot:CAMPEP_0203755132 /NCGR_PEP_ID=MMETSP0098-20131031/8632_1 /ASSEMBLY_ACC=CAM_ASM_000208 /TAXON_ID=96639 /ORGANISM=" , Strain NY0313808BC1" /LENGTH=854 /DNA_ID=CAMNT_0050646463 /DNA_START=22 /DNA_END=2586 /DNA_ORIENTATION=-
MTKDNPVGGSDITCLLTENSSCVDENEELSATNAKCGHGNGITSCLTQERACDENEVEFLAVVPADSMRHTSSSGRETRKNKQWRKRKTRKIDKQDKLPVCVSLVDDDSERNDCLVKEVDGLIDANNAVLGFSFKETETFEFINAQAPVDKWGALVDAAWVKNWSKSASQAENRINRSIHRIENIKRSMYTPAFDDRMYKLASQTSRSPGSGVFAFDKIRCPRDRTKTESGTVSQRSRDNLHSVLSTYKSYHDRRFARYLDLEMDGVYSVVKRLLLLQKECDEFGLLAALFYSRSWWISKEKIKTFWMIENPDKSLSRLVEAQVVKSRPTDFVDGITLVKSLSVKALKENGMKPSMSKRCFVNCLYSDGPEETKKFCYQLPEFEFVRMNRDIFRALHRCHIYLFAYIGEYSPGATKTLLTKHNLSVLQFGGDQETTTAGSKENGNDDLYFLKLTCIERRNSLYRSMQMYNDFHEYVNFGEDRKAYIVLHEASCKLVAPPQNASRLQLLETKLLAQICMSGCHLLERERRYSDAEHYLQLVVHATKGVEMLLDVHADAVSRYATDMEHRKDRKSALAALESLLCHENTVLGCRLYPANKTSNRLGGIGAGLMRQCIRLSVPPYRWSSTVDGLAALLQTKSFKIHATRNNGVWVGSKSVEQVVLDHLSANGNWKGVHAENSVGTTIFALLFWDIIFAPRKCKGTVFMEMPSQVRTGTWVVENQTLIQNRINDIEESMDFITRKIAESWSKFFGVQVHGMNWDWDKEDLILLVKGLPARVIAMICSLYCENYKCWLGGLPDLIVWKTEGAPHTKFVEVKGPGDSLSDRQKAWIDKLCSVDADIEICLVEVGSGLAEG